MTIVTVNSAAALTKALATAHGGDTIDLAPGTYSNISVYKVNFTTPVTITSQDPAHAAIISGLSVNLSSGLTFSDLQITPNKGLNSFAGTVYNSNQISFSHDDFKGSTTVAPSSQAGGLSVQDSTNLSVQNSHFEYVNTAISDFRNDHVQISNNAFDHIGTDGIDNGADGFVMISNNNFTNFSNSIGTAHPDAIQFWTPGMTTASHDITVTGNVYERGTGTPTQGIYMNDELGTLPYKNVTISNNAILGSAWNGIWLADAVGQVSITGNTVASWAGQDTNTGANLTGLLAQIITKNVSGAKVTETGNSAQSYVVNGSVNQLPAGNSKLGAVSDSGLGLLHNWAAGHSSTLPSFSSDLLNLLGVGSTVHSSVGLL